MKKTDNAGMGEALKLHLWAAKVWWEIEPKLILTTVFHALVQALTPYVTIWLSAQIINELAGRRNPTILWRWVIITVAVTAGLNLLTAVLYHVKAAVHGIEDYQEDRLMFKKLLEMDFVAVESPETNDLRYSIRRHQMGNVYGFMNVQNGYLTRIVGGIASIAGAIALTVSLFTQRIPQTAGSLKALDHPLTSVGLAFILIAGVIASSLLEAKGSMGWGKLWPYFNRKNRMLNFAGELGDVRSNALDVRMYDQQIVVREALKRVEMYQKGSPDRKILLSEIAPYPAAGTAVSTLMIGAAYVFVCLKAWAGAFGVGAVTQYVGAITRVCSGMSDLFGILGDMPSNAAYLRDIHAYLSIPNNMYQGSLTTEKRSDRQYDVEFRDVSFQYPGSETYALRHVNMKFKVGSRLAVVGENGSGKTTFIKLLCRLYDPTEGEILLNGIDIRKYRYDDYMNIFSVVFQDFQLAALPLGENVAASADYDPDRVRESLIKAGFRERLETLPKSLDTSLYKQLDKDGIEISGGEAQKIAIARALYKDSPFIILDEPTAALDPIAEAEIYAQFNEISGDKTAIYISHRLSSCKFCDEIAVFHEGAVIQQGTHEKLVSNVGGKYYELWNAQAQYYTG